MNRAYTHKQYISVNAARKDGMIIMDISKQFRIPYSTVRAILKRPAADDSKGFTKKPKRQRVPNKLKEPKPILIDADGNELFDHDPYYMGSMWEWREKSEL